MPADRAVMLNEVRYSERLCQRTARLYRHVQSAGTWLTIVGGSGALTAISKSVPDAVAVGGAILFTLAGAMLVAMRPADKAAQNEVDMKRYTALRAKADKLSDEALRQAIDEARSGDAPEVEALRDVVYNDVVEEVGQPTFKVPLKTHQRLLAAIA